MRNWQPELMEHVLRADLPKARALCCEWTEEHPLAHVVVDLLEPMLREMGRRWESCEGASLAQAYIASRLVDEAMAERDAAVANSLPTGSTRGVIVLGNAEDDYHALGRRIVASFARAAGFEVHDLGNDVPVTKMADVAEEVGAKIIGVSAMTYTNAQRIHLVRDEIDCRGLAGRMQLAVGGAVFVLRPELVNEVGGDGTAANAADAIALFERLMAANGITSPKAPGVGGGR